MQEEKRPITVEMLEKAIEALKLFRNLPPDKQEAIINSVKSLLAKQ